MKKSLLLKKIGTSIRKQKMEIVPRNVSYRVSYDTSVYEIEKINNYLKIILENKIKFYNDKE